MRVYARRAQEINDYLLWHKLRDIVRALFVRD